MTFTTIAQVSTATTGNAEPAPKKCRMDERSISRYSCKTTGAAQESKLKRKQPTQKITTLAEHRGMALLRETIAVVTRQHDLSSASSSQRRQWPATYNRYQQEVYPQFRDIGVHSELSYSGSAAGMCQQKKTQRNNYCRYSQEKFSDNNENGEIQTEATYIGTDFNNVRQRLSGSSLPLTSKVPLAIPVKIRQPASLMPIIIVPNAVSGTMINLFNAKDVIQDSSFVTPDARRAQKNQKPTNLTIQRKRNGQLYNIRVIDNAERLTNKEWDRVIGCFVLGLGWQFKGWKWGGNPTTIFANIPAFHLYADDRKPSGRVPNWSVRTIPVAMEKRHQDKARFSVIWDVIDGFVKKNKPELRSRIGL